MKRKCECVLPAVLAYRGLGDSTDVSWVRSELLTVYTIIPHQTMRHSNIRPCCVTWGMLFVSCGRQMLVLSETTWQESRASFKVFGVSWFFNLKHSFP